MSNKGIDHYLVGEGQFPQPKKKKNHAQQPKGEAAQLKVKKFLHKHKMKIINIQSLANQYLEGS